LRALDPPNPLYDGARTQAALDLKGVEDALAAKTRTKKTAAKK
jgi:hypothetical protein